MIIQLSDDLDKKILVRSEMIEGLSGYAIYGFRVGDIASIKDLLYALLVSSSADAANILAIGTTGSISKFSDLMNKELATIGVTHSRFDNPVGMDSPNNYSTAKDMAQILMYALKNPVFKEIFETREYKSDNLKKEIKSTLYSYEYDTTIIKGAKTGFTKDSGRCLASTAIINNIPYLLIVLNAPIEDGLNVKDSIDLYYYYSQNYGYINVINHNQNYIKIKVVNGKQREYIVKAKEDVNLYIPNSYSNEVKIIYDGVGAISKNISYKDKIGEIKVMHGDDVIYKEDVFLEQKIKYHNQKADIAILVFIAMLFGFFNILLIIRRYYEQL